MTRVSDRTFIFLHLPKSGGSSFEYNVYSNIRPSAIFNYTVDPSQRSSYTALTAEDKGRIRYIIAKEFGAHSDLTGPFSYVTMVRDPVDRVLSEYFYSLSTVRHFHHEIQSGNLSLIEFCELHSAHVKNYQTKLIAGCYENSVRTLNIAKDNIRNHFLAVGTLDRFHEFMHLLGRLLGWEKVHNVSMNTVYKKPSRSEIPEDVLRYLERNNQLDIDLMDFIRQRFEETLIRHGIDKDRNATPKKPAAVNDRVCLTLPSGEDVIVSGNRRDKELCEDLLQMFPEPPCAVDWVDIEGGRVKNGQWLEYVKSLYPQRLLPAAVIKNSLVGKVYREQPGDAEHILVLVPDRPLYYAIRSGCYPEGISPDVVNKTLEFVSIYDGSEILARLCCLSREDKSFCLMMWERIIIPGFVGFDSEGKGGILIYGTGGAGLNLKAYLQQVGKGGRPVGWIDRDPGKTGSMIDGLTVFSPSGLPDRDSYETIIIASSYWRDILERIFNENDPLVIRRTYVFRFDVPDVVHWTHPSIMEAVP